MKQLTDTKVLENMNYSCQGNVPAKQLVPGQVI